MKNTIESNQSERTCLACGKIHLGELCPLIQKKYDKINYKQTPFIVGNIFLKCMEKNVDFIQILCEMVEYREHFKEVQQKSIHSTLSDLVDLVDLDILNYFAISLDCKPTDFLIPPKETIKKYASLFKPSYDGVQIQRNDKGHIEFVSLDGDITGFHSHYNEFLDINRDPFCLEKIYTNKEPFYQLTYQIPSPIGYPEFSLRAPQNIPLYYWISIDNISYRSFKLAIDTDGALKDVLEKEFKDVWYDDDYVDTFPYDDPRVEIWLSRLHQATANNTIRWKKVSYNTPINTYTTQYGHFCFAICSGLDIEHGDADLLYMRQDNGLGHRFGRRERSIGEVMDNDNIFLPRTYGVNETTTPNVIEPGYGNKKIQELVPKIERNILDQSQTPLAAYGNINTPKRKQLHYTDVIVTSQSLVCNNGHHSVVPMIGIVPLLTQKNQQIDYEIYVGHCIECDKYFVFQSDFDEMLLSGKPLCQVIYDSSVKEKQKIPFQYKSQSVLNAMGYTVSANIKLTFQERQQILEKALLSNLFSVHDLLNFLNWLVNTRKGQSKYSSAISKWQEDITFVENYQKKGRESTFINSMTVK